MSLTEGALSPDLFRRWSAIALVAGALERRVWVKIGRRITFPNLYILLVAPPGVGKYIIEEVRELWSAAAEPGTRVPAFKVAPDSMTRASIMDTLGAAKGTTPLHVHPMQMYHSLLVAAEEFAVLLPSYDLDFIGVLNKIFNNPPDYKEKRRTGSVRELNIEFPQLNLLGGAQPGWLGSVFPEEAWSTGLTSRMLMVFSPETPLKDMFADPGDQVEQRALILDRLGAMSQLYGPVKLTEGAERRMGAWHLTGGPPAPSHSKLAHYNRRRTTLHMPKLALVSAISRTGKRVIELVDVERAIHWLLEAETLMPDIFRSMLGKSDTAVIEEMHYFLTQLWTRGGRVPVHERMLIGFLSQRTTSDKITKVLEIAERANIIVRHAGIPAMYTPKPKHEHGME